MSLNKIQKTFISLAKARWVTNVPYSRISANRRRVKKKRTPITGIKITVIDAVTGDKTQGYAPAESKAKLKKWLKLRNIRAEFTDVVLKKKSAWFKLDDGEFIDYPIIVQVGAYKAPYLVKRVQDRKTRKGVTTIKIQLETAENIDYLAILSRKKELLASKGKK
jgi:hypothetical protein